MAETLKQPRKQQKRKAARSKPSRQSSGTTQSKPVSSGQDAGDLLRDAIDEAVKANSRKIAEAMVNKTIDGSASVARLLVDFTGAKKRHKPAEEEPSGMSWAQCLASEARWQGPVDPDHDVGYGGREPEV